MVKVKCIGDFRYQIEIDEVEALVLSDVASQLHLPGAAVIRFLLTGCLQEDDKNILLQRRQDELAR